MNPTTLIKLIFLKSWNLWLSKVFILKSLVMIVQNQPHMAIQLNNFSLWEILSCCEKNSIFLFQIQWHTEFFLPRIKKFNFFLQNHHFSMHGNQNYIRIYFFHSYFVNSQIWLNQLMDDLVWLHHKIERKRPIQLLWFPSFSVWFFLSIWI